MRSQRAVRHVIPSRSAQVTADRVPSEKNILEASESLSFSLERQRVPRQRRVFAFRVACVRCCAPSVPAVSPHPPTDRAPRCCGAALSASSMSDCGDGVEWSGVECRGSPPGGAPLPCMVSKNPSSHPDTRANNMTCTLRFQTRYLNHNIHILTSLRYLRFRIDLSTQSYSV